MDAVDLPPRKKSAFRLFLKSFRGRILIAMVLIVIVHLIQILIIARPYYRERGIGNKLSSSCGFGYSYGYCGPAWVAKLYPGWLWLFDRITGIHVVYQSSPSFECKCDPDLKTEAEMLDVLTDIQSLKNLETLDIHGTQVKDSGLEKLAGLTELKVLRIDGTRITDTGLVHLQGLNKLYDLGLSGTHVTDVGLRHLRGLKNIVILNLDDLRITDEGLEHLKGITSLRDLNLTGTKTTAEGRALLRKALPLCKIQPEP